jgi:hypothetical protein
MQSRTTHGNNRRTRFNWFKWSPTPLPRQTTAKQDLIGFAFIVLVLMVLVSLVRVKVGYFSNDHVWWLDWPMDIIRFSIHLFTK